MARQCFFFFKCLQFLQKCLWIHKKLQKVFLFMFKTYNGKTIIFFCMLIAALWHFNRNALWHFLIFGYRHALIHLFDFMINLSYFNRNWLTSKYCIFNKKLNNNLFDFDYYCIKRFSKFKDCPRFLLIKFLTLVRTCERQAKFIIRQ